MKYYTFHDNPTVCGGLFILHLPPTINSSGQPNFESTYENANLNKIKKKNNVKNS